MQARQARTYESHGPWNTPRPVDGKCDLAHRLYDELKWACPGPNDREDPFKQVYGVFVPRIAKVAASGSERDEAALFEAMRLEIARLA